MNLENFSWRVSPEVLDRGLSYYREGRVETLEEEAPLTYSARVKGAKDYGVRVMLSTTGEILTSTCDCPYQGGPVCKHQVAVYQMLADRLNDALAGQRPGDSEELLMHLPHWRQRELLRALSEKILWTEEDHLHVVRHETIRRFQRELEHCETKAAFLRLVESTSRTADAMTLLDMQMLLRARALEYQPEIESTIALAISENVGRIAEKGGEDAATLLEFLFSPRLTEQSFRLELLEIFHRRCKERKRQHQVEGGLREIWMYASGVDRERIADLLGRIDG